jgi:RNA polymerase sigma-70 factor (ECF subfamily)
LNAVVTGDGADEDAVLMAEFVQTRDRRRFERLFQRHRRAMVAYAGRYVRDRERAEELAQEVFVRVYRTREYRPDASFRTWLYRVATNVCLNELRRGEHKQRMESLDAVGDDARPRELAAPADASPEARVSGRELASRLQSCLDALPENQRAAFVMARYEGLPHTEIADALGTSVPSVKSLIHRALETLRREASAVLADPVVGAEAT